MTNILHQNPTLFQVNTRVMLTELTKQLGRSATLDDIPDSFLDDLAQRGMAWVYFLSVWQTGEAGRQISRNHPGWKKGFQRDIPDLTDEDICGSGFAITDYQLHSHFGEPDALLRLKKRINSRGMKLMLDLVPNHTAIDHGWATTNPEYFIHADEDAIARARQNFIEVNGRILAHGRDPYFDGWPDTLQLNYGNPDFRKAMVAEISRIATVCDGLRCDMAMLVLPDVFMRTWGEQIEPFWSDAIATIRKEHPDFVFMAEVYWDREYDLQQLGFDFTYDKRLYDRLRVGETRPVREHFLADREYQQRSARFLENHDEPRAAGTFDLEKHKAAAILTFLSPGLRFLHQGQFEGYRKKVSVHVSRKPTEQEDPQVAAFYKLVTECLKLPVVHEGEWQLLDCTPAWDGNWTWDSFIAFSWTNYTTSDQLIAIVNYSDHHSQCYVDVPPVEYVTPQKSYLHLMLADSGNTRALQSLDATNTENKLFVDFPPCGFEVFRR
ncbi:MAG: alpha-amylase family glycosyl hydrolase [Candidatus Melainabacteria bacterium]|nr:alpha-amylase family glycosyl hydrolase [Candidatus Melainabacteria bacterium]